MMPDLLFRTFVKMKNHGLNQENFKKDLSVRKISERMITICRVLLAIKWDLKDFNRTNVSFSPFGSIDCRNLFRLMVNKAGIFFNNCVNAVNC